MSRVTVFQSNINSFMQRNALSFGGSTIAGQSARANRIGDRMVAQARRNASGEVVQRRTGALAASVVKIIRPHPRGGITVGVGTTLLYGKILEEGSEVRNYPIGSLDQLLASDRSRTDIGALEHPVRGPVTHPGVDATHWLRKAVLTVIGRGGVV